ncbi:MAG: hypothetical protein IKP66_01160 [Lachnospiraceae bacterium]|nr:hypothetical protein [Lachnospiraceae bacterium]
MALKRPAPKQISAEVAEQLTQASATQTTGQRAVKTYDPQFPVFDIPVNQKILVYIPNHVVTNPDGTTGLRMDSFLAHPVIDGRSYGNVRCINGIQNDDPQLNWDGTCPLCTGISDVWDLYRHEIADIARSKGIDPELASSDETLKADRMELARNRVIREAERWYTFPIVVIECEEKDGVLSTQPKVENGSLVGHPMFYSIRESTFIEKWVAGYDSIDGPTPTSPAGLWAVLNFTYTPKSGKPDKMGSAKNLKVIYKTMEGYDQWATYFDQITADWTPAKAQEVVVLDTIRSMQETQEVADSILKPVREKLALYNIGGNVNNANAIPQNTNAAQALANFGGETPAIGTSAPATPVAPAPAPAPAVPTASAPAAPAPAAPTAPAAPAMPMMGDINNVGIN